MGLSDKLCLPSPFFEAKYMLRKILKILGCVVLLLVLAIAIVLYLNYHPDKDYNELKDKYSLNHSRFIEIKGMPIHYTIEGEGRKGFTTHSWHRRFSS